MSVRNFLLRCCFVVVASAAASIASAAVRFHPGHYAYIGPTVQGANLAAARQSIIDTIKAPGFFSNTNIVGVKVLPYWAVLEGPNANEYHDTFIDAILQAAKDCNKRVIISIGERIFGGYANIGSNWFPAYLGDPQNSQYKGGWVEEKDDSEDANWSGNLSAAIRIWEPPVMERLIALTKHICQRYESDTNLGPYLEMLQLGETALAVPTTMGFDRQGMITQQRQWMDQVRTACPTIGLRLNLNYTSVSLSATTSLIEYAIARDVAVGGPDPELPLPLVIDGRSGPRTVLGNQLWRGNTQVTCLDDSSKTCWTQGGGTDFRNSGVWTGEQQLFGYQGVGSGGYNETPQEILDYQVGTMRARYMIWTYNTSAGNDGQKWSTGIVPTINANGGKVSDNDGKLVAPASVPCLYSRGCSRN